MNRLALGMATLALVAVAGSAPAQSPQLTSGRFALYVGTLTAGGGSGEVTISLDTATGRTWILGTVGNNPTWLAIPYSQNAIAGALPPPANPNDPLGIR